MLVHVPHPARGLADRQRTEHPRLRGRHRLGRDPREGRHHGNARPGGLFNIQLHGTGLVALLSDGEPLRLDVAEAPTFGDPQAAIAWSCGVSTSLKTDVQAKSLIGMGSGGSVQLGLSGDGWVLVHPSEGRQIVRS